MNGWLSPTGEFFPCKPMEHQIKARELVGVGETWVAVYPSGAFTERPLTQAQIEWLIASKQNSQSWEYKDLVDWLLEKQEDYVDHDN